MAIYGIQLFLALPAPIHAYEFSEGFSIDGTLASAAQCQVLSNSAESENRCRGALPARVEISYRPTRQDEFFSKIGFAAGNGLNTATPFVGSLWAADLEDDVRNVNGRGRDYLLTAWYKHTFDIAGNDPLGVTLGIIDTTDYLDNDAYAHNEYTQFMNPMLVTSRSGFFRSPNPVNATEQNPEGNPVQGQLAQAGAARQLSQAAIFFVRSAPNLAYWAIATGPAP